jgi:Leucine-rich repeat (LRR) protein
MMPPFPPGRIQEQELRDRLADIADEIAEVRSALPQVNDAALRPRVEALVRAGSLLSAAYGEQPGPDIAEALVGLASAARALRVPARDPDLGVTPTLRRLREAKGLIATSVEDALEAAQALGLRPRQVPMARELAIDVPRAGNEVLTQALLNAVNRLGQQVEALEQAKTEPTQFTQQMGMLNVYLPAMRVEIDLARLQLTVGEETIDFGALGRAVGAMVDLTRDFLATVRAWVDRLSEPVVTGARAVEAGVRFVASGYRMAGRWIAARLRPPSGLALEAPSLSERPAGFSTEEVYRRVLAGEAIPQDWIPFVDILDLPRTGLADTRPLATLTSLHYLDLDGTQVSDVAPLAALTSLQNLVLSGTRVSDAAPLAALTSLQFLGLRDTQVNDVAPLAALTSLRILNLAGTRVSDMTPLAALTSLQYLYLSGTQVSDAATLAALTGLQHLDLSATHVSNVTPLAALTSLQNLVLSGTQVSDVAPLAALTSLQMLDLSSTRVSDVAPLAALASLQNLYLSSTRVSDVAPLAALTSLQTLYLSGTQVSDVAPLAALTSLQRLDLRGTQVSDVAPLASLASLQRLDLRGTQVKDVGPLDQIEGLEIIGGPRRIRQHLSDLFWRRPQPQ